MRIIETKCIIERNNIEKDKYYPKLISINTTSTFPWSCSTVTIEITTNTDTDTSGYMSPIRIDDIIRVQVNIMSSSDEKPVWQDIFEGHILSIGSNFGINNITSLICSIDFLQVFSQTAEKLGVEKHASITTSKIVMNKYFFKNLLFSFSPPFKT